ncbi:hypothetical protein MAAFP003_3202 [Mycobacterium ahvazicum]|uniref:Uncharacterized protein n=1 Tax=Mycobacterium ahvazicum TaxID=1964395 RepID=A0A2K4YCM9_9MYCO|nr:hypothetical protein MAAFP003_3202 [Mycobacterium ahvazicum]
MAPAVAEIGVPACIPLSKLCTKSAGVTGWTGLAGAVGAAIRGVPGVAAVDGTAVCTPGLGGASGDGADADGALGKIEGDGNRASAGVRGEGDLNVDVRFVREPGAPGTTCPSADGGGLPVAEWKFVEAPVATPAGAVCPPTGGAAPGCGVAKPGVALGCGVVPGCGVAKPGVALGCGVVPGCGVVKPGGAPACAPLWPRLPLTYSSRFFSSSGGRNICPTLTPLACAN